MGAVDLKSLSAGVSAAFEALASLVFPEACYICGRRSRDPACSECVASFSPIVGPTCHRCGKPTAVPVPECRECRGRGFAFRSAIAAVRYDGPVREAIHALKYGNGRRLAPQLAELIAARLDGEFAGTDFITFVPMTGRKRVERGYNQAKLLADELGRIMGKRPVALLRRARASVPQSGLSLDERRRNVKGAFEPTRTIRGRALLVDDVYTTGSTADECARALLKAGAGEVLVATVARTVIDLVI